MNIDSIKDGIVIDHITAGKGMELYRLLKLDQLDCSVALIKNAVSQKMGKKDILKIDTDFHVDMDILGYVDPGVTVAIIRDGVIVKKLQLTLPEQLTNVIFCKNPRCISSTEQELPHVFRLTDPKTRTYRCLYCTQNSHRDALGWPIGCHSSITLLWDLAPLVRLLCHCSVYFPMHCFWL